MFSEVEDGIAFAGELAQNLLMVILLMNKEGVAFAGDFEQIVISVEIGIAGGFANDDTLAFGGAHVLSPGHLEIGEQDFGAGADVEYPAASSMY